MEKEDEIIAEDRKLFPHCQYSTSSRQTCSNQSGAFVCESIQQIQRLCPSKAPVTIYTHSNKESGNPNMAQNIPEFPSNSWFGFGDLFDSIFKEGHGGKYSKDDILVDHFQKHEDFISHFFDRSMRDSIERSVPLPRTIQPPHRSQTKKSDEHSTDPLAGYGQVSGPVEEI